MATSRVRNPRRGKRKTLAASRVSNKKRGKTTKEKEKEKEKEEENGDLVLLHQSPNWINLPSDLLPSIFERISCSIPDILSFSAACTSWRSLAKSSLNAAASPPPLLLSGPSQDPYPPKRSSMCHLRNVIPNYRDHRTFCSPISKRALNRNCCGCSYGHLIFADTCDTSVLIADLFSPDRIRLPRPPTPRNLFSHITHGVLTAPPSSPSSILLLVCSPNIYCWRLGEHPRKWLVFSLPSPRTVLCVTLFKGMLLILHGDGTVSAFGFVGRYGIQWKRLPDARCVLDCSYARLAECDGELLLLCFMCPVGRIDWRNSIRVFIMDFKEGAWMRVESIGDWCLFMDFVGRCPSACPRPGRWGGQPNCVYFLGPHNDRWIVLPLDGTKFNHELDVLQDSFGEWPSPAWVYPTWIGDLPRIQKTQAGL